MALNGYVLHVDLSPVRELVSLQRRCSNNLNQVAVTANTYGGIYPEDIRTLQKDYADLWGPLSKLLKSSLRSWSSDLAGERRAAPRFSQLRDTLSQRLCFPGAGRAGGILYGPPGWSYNIHIEQK